MRAHDSYTHLQDLTGLQTVQVSSLLGNLDRQLQTPNLGGLSGAIW